MGAFSTLSFSEKIIVPELSKNSQKQLIITLKIKEIRYLVKDGDTIKSIAKKFQMSVEELMRRNKIEKHEDLKVGQLIWVDERR